MDHNYTKNAVALTIPRPFERRVSPLVKSRLNLAFAFSVNRKHYKQKFTSQELLKLRGISKGISPSAYNQTYLPKFNVIVRLLCLQSRSKYRDNHINFSDLYDLFRALYWFTIAYHTFQSRNTTTIGALPSCTVQWIFKSINEVLIQKAIPSNNTKAYSGFSSELAVPRIWKINLQKHSSAAKTYCDIYIASLACVINTRATIHNIETIDQKETGTLLKDITDLFLLLESFCHIAALIIIQKSTSTNQIGVSSAYRQLFERRRKNIPKTFVKNLTLSFEKPAIKKTLKIIIRSIIDIIPAIDWDQLRQVVLRHEKGHIYAKEVNSIQKYIQATLLIMDDLDLITQFQLVQRCIIFG